MAEKLFIDHRELKMLRDKSKKAAPLLVLANTMPQGLPQKPDQQVLQEILPLSVAQVSITDPAHAQGHMMPPDGRLAVRIVLDSEAKQKFGASGLTYREGANLMLRLSMMEDIENAGLMAQEVNARLRIMLLDLLSDLLRGVMPSPSKIKRADRLYEETSS